MIKKMLTAAESRLTTQQVLEHKWLQDIGKIQSEPFPSTVIKQLRRFRKYQKVKQAALTYMATQLSEAEIRPLRLLFLKLDKNGDGLLSIEEILGGLEGHEKAGELVAIAKSLDTNESGFVEYNGIRW